MKTIKKEDIMPFLKNSQLYRTFENENQITIPEKYIIDEIRCITSQQYFDEIMEKLRYWMIDKLPDDVYRYVKKNRNINISRYNDFFYDDLYILQTVRSRRIMNEAAKKGLVNLIDFLYRNNVFFGENVALDALKNDHFECFKMIIKYNQAKKPFNYVESINTCFTHYKVSKKRQIWFEQLTDKCFAYVAKSGQLEILKYLYSIDTDNECYRSTIIANQFECFKFLCDNDHISNYHTAVWDAIKYDKLEIIQYLYNHLTKINKANIFFSCRDYTSAKSLKMFKYLQSIGVNICTTSSDLICNMIQSNDVEYVKYAVSCGVRMCSDFLDRSIGHYAVPRSCLEEAAKKGNLEMFMYFIEYGFHTCPKLFKSAITGGNLDIITYLYDHSKIENGYVDIELKNHGTLEMLNFFVERGYKPNKYNYSANYVGKDHKRELVYDKMKKYVQSLDSSKVITNLDITFY